MTYPNKITAEQEAILNQFTCERLKEDPRNYYMAKHFGWQLGPGLAAILQEAGWRRDAKGTTAYYVIKNPEGQAVLYFSLKCGVLVDPSYEETLGAERTDKDLLQRALDGANDGDEQSIRYLEKELERLGEEAFNDKVRNLNRPALSTGGKMNLQNIEILDGIRMDKDKDPNKKLVYVDRTHSAVEMVEFCNNNDTKDCWEQYDMCDKRLGETLFWKFIVAKMLELSDLVGCEYAYLFAADQNMDGSLMTHYRNMHFKKYARLGTVKPEYDNFCYFMCRRLLTIDPEMQGPEDVVEEPRDLLGLDYFREEFFNHFNEPRKKPK